MFIKRFELHLYKPLLHNNIKHVVVDDLTQQTVLVAPNGFGKSSIMRELTPYPACRSDYEKHGKKIIEIQHEKSYYILTSDFSKINGAHSFLKDDVELNQSGTTEVQESLVAQHFGYSQVIDKLLSGEYQICSMGTAARKELVYNTYPTSLTFILDKYQALKSAIRTCSNQLKLLNERKLKLTDLLLKDETLQYFEQYRKDLNHALSVLDREIYAMNKTSGDIKNQISLLKMERGSEASVSLESILQECRKISREMFDLKLNHEVDLVVPEQLDRLIGKLSAQVETGYDKKNTLTDRGTQLSSEIDKIRTSLQNDTATAIQECKQLIEVQEEIIQQNKIEDDTPIVPLDEALKLEEYMDKIREDLQFLQGYVPIITHKEYNDLLAERALLEGKLQQLQPEVQRLSNVIVETEKKIHSLTDKHSYPADCKRSCKLRENLESVLRSYEMELEDYKRSYQRDHKILKDTKHRYDEVNTTVEGQRAARLILLKLETLFTRKTWGLFVCSDLDPLEAINQDVTKIINRCLKVVQKAKAHAKVKEAEDKLTGLRAKLSGLQASDQPVKEYLTKSLVEKEYELNQIGKQLSVLDSRLASTELSLQVYKDHLNLHNRITHLNGVYHLWQRLFVHEEELKCLDDMMWYLQDVKNQINEKLRELETIVKEQSGYLTRLKEEIEPSIQEISVKMKKLVAIADQLSPTSGIPYRYTVRYVNTLLHMANAFIRQVWNYDIELAYFDENKQNDFDFNFKLLINHNSEVKDIKLCSKSQKSIINLVMRLAICIYRGYIQQYPVKLDEIDDGCSPVHQDRLTAFLVEFLNKKNILQAFVVNQSVAVSSSFTDAGMILLSDDETVPEHCIVKSKIN